MKLVLHLLRKDLRASWIFYVLTWTVAAAAYGFFTVPVTERFKVVDSFFYLPFLTLVLVFVTTATLILRDSVVSESAMLRTKPISLGTLFGSKGLAMLILIVPMTVVQCVSLMWIGILPGWMEGGLIFCESLLASFVVAMAAAILAIRQPNFRAFWFSVASWSLTLMAAWAVYVNYNSWRADQETEQWSYAIGYLKSSRQLMVQIVWVVGLVATLVIFAKARRHDLPGKGAMITGLLTLAIWFYWPVNFVQALVPPEPHAPIEEWPDHNRITASFEPERYPEDLTRFLTFTDGGRQDGTYRYIRGNARLTGLPEGWYCPQNFYESTLTLPNGTIIRSRQDSPGGMLPMMYLQRNGIPRVYNHYEGRMTVSLAEFKLEKAKDAMTGATLEGTVQFPLKRVVILARIPFKVGASALVQNHLITITQIERRENGFFFSTIDEFARVRSQGQHPGTGGNERQQVVVHPSRGEYLSPQSSGFSRRTRGAYSIISRKFDRAEINTGKDVYPRIPIPADWADGAELVIVGHEYGGTYSQPFEFRNVDLRHGTEADAP
jgi:hypothetical protein